MNEENMYSRNVEKYMGSTRAKCQGAQFITSRLCAPKCKYVAPLSERFFSSVVSFDPSVNGKLAGLLIHYQNELVIILSANILMVAEYLFKVL